MTTLSFLKGHTATYMKKPISLELIDKKVNVEVASVCSVERQASCGCIKTDTRTTHTYGESYLPKTDSTRLVLHMVDHLTTLTGAEYCFSLKLQRIRTSEETRQKSSEQLVKLDEASTCFPFKGQVALDIYFK